jgi:hypothetical protein
MWEKWSGFGWKPAFVRVDAEGRGSGPPVASELTIFYWLEDGLVAKAVFQPGRSPQLQGYGLCETGCRSPVAKRS